ncbi:unnamed protein product, partial [Sphacelaria rigidula]
LTGWGFVDEQEAEEGVLRPSMDDVGRGQGAGTAQGAVPVAFSSERRIEEAAATGENREVDAGAVDGMAKLEHEKRHGHDAAEAVTAATDAARGTALREEDGTMHVDARIERGRDEMVASSAGQQSSANDPHRAAGVFDILRRFRSSGARERRRDTETLTAVVRTTGGELYGLRDRLDELTTAIQRRPLISNGPGEEAVAAAEKAVVSSRSLLRRADNEMNNGAVEPVIKPGHVRRVFEMATRRVRQAERTVKAEMISLEEADARRALALDGVSGCRRDLDATRIRWQEATIRCESAAATAAVTPVSLALREAQRAVDAASDHLRQPLRTMPSRRKDRHALSSADEQVVEACTASVKTFITMVDDYCSLGDRVSPIEPRTSDDAGSQPAAVAERPPRRPGERLMMQARALRRAMLDPTVVSGQVGRRDEAHGHAFRAALERLDAVLAKADRLAGGAGGGEGDSRALGADDRDVGDDAFSDAATEAFLAALELQKAGEADTDEEGDRKQAARTLLQLALSELEELEVNVQTWGVDIERSVTTVLGAARRGLESVSRDLGDTPVGDGVEATASSAGRSEGVRVEALVASGALESALGALDSGRTEVRRVRKLLDLEARAKTILHDERERVDALSEEAKVLG